MIVRNVKQTITKDVFRRSITEIVSGIYTFKTRTLPLNLNVFRIVHPSNELQKLKITAMIIPLATGLFIVVLAIVLFFYFKKPKD